MKDNIDPKGYKRLFETANTPSEYTNSIYLFYMELAEITELTERLVMKHLEHSELKKIINITPTSYLLHASIQDIPNIVRDFGINNLAVYQIVRLSKIRAIV